MEVVLSTLVRGYYVNFLKLVPWENPMQRMAKLVFENDMIGFISYTFNYTYMFVFTGNYYIEWVNGARH